MTKYKQYMLTSLMAVTVATGIQLGTISTVQAEDARSMPTLSERMKKIAMYFYCFYCSRSTYC